MWQVDEGKKRILSVEVSQTDSLALVTTNGEKSAEAIVARKFL